MLLNPLYTAPLPAGFTSGTVEIKSPGTYVDQAGRVQQPSYRFSINADGSLTSLQVGGASSIVGMGVGDRSNAPNVDVVIELRVAGSPVPFRTTYNMVPFDSGSGTLRLQQEKQTAPVIVTASVISNLSNQTALYVMGTENISIGAASLAVETFQPVAPAATAASVTAAATTGTNSGLASAGLLAQYQSATAAMPTTPTATDLTNYGVIRGYRTLASGAAQPTLYNRTSGVWADDPASITLSKPLNAIGNTAIPQLATKSQADGPQFVDGSRWVWFAADPADGRQITAAQDAGAWIREGTKTRLGRSFASASAAVSASLLTPVREVSGAASVQAHPSSDLGGLALTQGAAAGVSLFAVVDPTLQANTSDIQALGGRISRTFSSFDLRGNGSGNALTIGGTANFWAGAMKSYKDFYINNFKQGVTITANSYMLNFVSGTLTGIPVGGTGIINDPAGTNYGENIEFRNLYAYNNPGTIALLSASFGAEYRFVGCSLDYSALAVYVKNGARVILDECWIETNAGTTPNEYLHVEANSQLHLNNCMVVLGGDWSAHSAPFLNVGGDLVITGGRMVWTGTPGPRFISETGGGISRVSGTRFPAGTPTTGRLGASGSLISTADAALAGNLALSGDIITFTPAGAQSDAVWTVPVKPGDLLKFHYQWSTSALVIGAQAYMGLSGTLAWLSATGTVLGSTQILGVKSGTNAQREAVTEPETFLNAPPRARSARITITAGGGASGTAAVSQAECWVL